MKKDTIDSARIKSIIRENVAAARLARAQEVDKQSPRAAYYLGIITTLIGLNIELFPEDYENSEQA